MHEYNVRFGKSNERFQIAQKDRKERIAEYLENICTARKSRLNNYGVEPTIINGDKMLLHRNESSSEKTLNLTGYETYVKENYNLSRERVTVFTQVGNDPTLNMKPDCFQEKGYSNKDQWTWWHAVPNGKETVKKWYDSISVEFYAERKP